MNTRMYENPVVQDNLKLLEHYGYEVIQPASGHLACGDNGAGRCRKRRLCMNIFTGILLMRKI